MPEEFNTTAQIAAIPAAMRPVGVISGWASGRSFFLQHTDDYLFFSVDEHKGIVTFNAPASPEQDYNQDNIYECVIQVEYGNGHIDYKKVRVENDRRAPLKSYPYGFSECFGLLPIKPILPPIPRYTRLWTH